MAKNLKMNISTYLSVNFTKSFFTIFLPLFVIGSLVFIIKISALTASIQISFIEMMQLFGYNLPSILFYILPISFLVAIVMTLIRLSNENELMALFALGSKATSIMHRFFFISILFSMVLLLLSLAVMPKTKQQFKAFKHEKATQAQVNISPSKLGQKFGNLFVYVKEKKENSLNNIVIYNRDKEHTDQLFMAESASIQNLNSVVTLSLNNGSGYTFTDTTLREINYEKMQIFKILNVEAFTYNNIVQYWTELSLNPKKKRTILFFIYLSFIPVMALYIIASFSIINPRYQKNNAYPILGLTTILLYVMAILLEKQGTVPLLVGAIILTFGTGLFLFKKYVLRFF